MHRFRLIDNLSYPKPAQISDNMHILTKMADKSTSEAIK